MINLNTTPASALRSSCGAKVVDIQPSGDWFRVVFDRSIPNSEGGFRSKYWMFTASGTIAGPAPGVNYVTLVPAIDLNTTPASALRSKCGAKVLSITPEDHIFRVEFNRPVKEPWSDEALDSWHYDAGGLWCSGGPGAMANLELIPANLINLTDTYVTRQGHTPVRVICVDGPDPTYPVVAFIGGGSSPRLRTAEGLTWVGETNNEEDLILKPAKPALPDLPSELITVALADLAKVEANPAYTINMATWHERSGRKCSVCFAGAVISQSLEADVTRGLTPFNFPARTRNKLLALNNLRLGRVTEALENLGLPAVDLPDFPVSEYATDRTKFRSNMTAFAAYLKALNL